MNDIQFSLSSRYILPKPGVNGAIHNVLQGKTIVLTGIFPQVGGGKGLYVGKHRVKVMCENFGGRVTSEISGQTDILIVGLEPGLVKVSQAFAYRVQQIDLFGLHSVIMGLVLLKDVTAPDISNFSTGYKNNGLPLLLSREEENNTKNKKSKDFKLNMNPVKVSNVSVKAKVLKKRPKMKLPKDKDLIVLNNFNLNKDGFCFLNTKNVKKTNTFEEECLNRDGFYFM